MVAENGSEMSWGNEYTMDTKFKIQFPKTLYKDANRDITYHIKLTLSGTDISSRIAVVRSILKPITVKAANLYGGYGALGNGILSIFRDYGGYSPFFGPQGLVYMPATPILPNNESTSAGVGANIPDNINILFSGRYEASISNYYDNLIAWLENSPDKTDLPSYPWTTAIQKTKHYSRNFLNGDTNIEGIRAPMQLGRQPIPMILYGIILSKTDRSVIIGLHNKSISVQHFTETE